MIKMCLLSLFPLLLLSMHYNNKDVSGKREVRGKSYFYITEQPPVKAVGDPLKTGIPVRLPRGNHFYIDFLDECKLRIMSKVQNRDSEFVKPLVTQKYGRNIVTNIEDSSVPEQKLTKFLQEKTIYSNKKNQIRSRLKSQINKSKEKLRSRSLFSIKQDMLDYYNFPIAIEPDKGKGRMAQFLQRSQKQRTKVLGKLGLIHQF